MPAFDFQFTPHKELLPDGRAAILIGDTSAWDIPAGMSENNPDAAGAANRCLAVLLQFLQRPGEIDLSSLAIADLEEQLRSAQLEVVCTQAETCEDLAQQIETGRFVVLFVNAGNLWQSAAAVEDGHANHAVLATAVARDQAGDLLAMLIRDPARKTPRYLSIQLLTSCWLKPSGLMITADEKLDF